MQKKLVLFILTFAFLLSPSIASADNNDQSGKFGRQLTYVYNDNTKTLTLSGSGEPYSDFSFSAEVKINTKHISFNNYTAETLPCFSDFESLEELIIPENIKYIPLFAFQYCRSLKNVTLSSNMRFLPRFSFSGCQSLKTFIVPGNIIYVDPFAFASSVVKSVVFSEGVKYISDNCFENCHSLESVSLPSTLEPEMNDGFGHSMFSNCEKLKSVKIPAGKIGTLMPLVFNNCINLETVLIPATVHEIASDAFDYCDKVTIIGAKGSYAEKYAKDKGIPFKIHDHTWKKQSEVIKEATCSEEGVEGIKCSQCDAIDDSSKKAIPKKQHEHLMIGEVIKQPTCVDAGVREDICSECQSKVEVSIPATNNHSFNKWIIIKEPTCFEEGVEGIKCSQCGIIKDSSKKAIPATNNHKFGAWKTTKKATELSKGKKTRVCSVCDKKEQKIIAKKKPSLSSIGILKPVAKKKAAIIKWKKISKSKQKKMACVQIQYSMDKSFKKIVKTITAKKTLKSKTIKKLKSKKKYYVRIRAYKKTKGVVHISKWSAKKVVTVK